MSELKNTYTVRDRLEGEEYERLSPLSAKAAEAVRPELVWGSAGR